MPPYTTSSESEQSVSAPEAHSGSREQGLESIAFYVLLATVILAPLAFLPTPYIVVDAVKTAFISIGAALSIVLYGIVVYKRGTMSLPPRGIFWSSVAVVASLVVSSLASTHVGKSFFGQGFEVNTASFLLSVFAASVAAFSAIRHKPERAILVYTGIVAAFLVAVLFHAIRLIAGPEFLSFGIFSYQVSTIVGTWNDLGAFGALVSLIGFSALFFLPLTGRIKVIYSVVTAVALAVAFLVNNGAVWVSAFVALLALAAYSSYLKPSFAGGFSAVLKRVAWVPAIVALVAGLMVWKGVEIAQPVIRATGTEYTTISLPWQLSLDIISGAIKENPLFGIGPNRFSQAYIAYKPLIVNQTIAWNTEFNYAFGLVPTFVATQGLFGTVAWISLFTLLGIYLTRALKRISDPHGRFLLVSSSIATLFLVVRSLIDLSSHAFVLYAGVMAAIALGVALSYGALEVYEPIRARSRKLSIGAIVFVVVCAVWCVADMKNTIALAYFGVGARDLTADNDPVGADKAFARAHMFNKQDVYLQARAETSMALARQVASTGSADMSSADAEALAQQVVGQINNALQYSRQAIQYDPTNHYNHLSEARVSELAASIGISDGYQTAVEAYTRAIQLNPLNPTIYLNLARLHASQNNLDEALQAVGAALQVKNNYLDAVFLYSQIEAARGNLSEAIAAARVGTQLNPQSPILFMQLGLLQYNNREYDAAAESLERALELQPDYANAQYFLGLSYVRLGRNADAIDQFTALADSNPDNQEVSLILSNLLSGKSPFADAQPPVTPNPERRTELPIKED